jgi:hypothetical protein
VRLRTAFGHRTGEKHRRRPGVIRARRHVGATRAGDVRMREPADYVDALAERLERLENLSKLEAGARRCRRPLVHRRAVRT